MISPQTILKDYLEDKFFDQNTEFIFPVYQEIFKNLVKSPIEVSEELTKQIDFLNKYFYYILKLAQKNKLILSNDQKHDAQVIGDLAKLIFLESSEFHNAVSSFNSVIDFIKKSRTNINNLEFLSWTLFGEERREDIIKKYEDNPEEIKQALLNPTFLLLLLKFPKLGDFILHDLLSPVELKKPSRMKGSFADSIFEIVFKELKEKIPNFQYLQKVNTEELKQANFWYIIEKTTSSINFPKSKPNSKQIDMVCKIDEILFICSHKEQKQGGGGQDNQAEDVGSIFEYNEEALKEIKEKFNVSNIILCALVEASGKVTNSNHWKGIISKVQDPNNKNKYLLNSFLFIELVKSIG